MVKHNFLAYFHQSKKIKKLPTFAQNHVLTVLEKSQFFNLIYLLFLKSKKPFFLSRKWTNPFEKIPIFLFY